MHPQVSKWLGGVTYLETIKKAAYTPRQGKVGFWYAEVDGKVVGTLLCGARPAAFRAKYGSIGVVPDYRRQRIGSALYAAMTMQTILEGKRLWGGQHRGR
jgi:GNAT superfamily N-acetyltransferase